MNFFKSLHLTRLLFLVLGIGILLVGLSFLWPWLMNVGKAVLLICFFATILDVLLVYIHKNPVQIERQLSHRMNLGDENKVSLLVTNTTNQPIFISVYEGYPEELEIRESFKFFFLLAKNTKPFHYPFIPKRRGEFTFENVFVFVRSSLFLVQRQIEISLKQTIKVYPSVEQMKKYELKVFNQQNQSKGIKRVRRIGNTSEFEQIRNYVQGDDLRTINWKATSRRNELMVNQFQEERSQQVYCLIDKSRTMQLEFDGLSMLDYAINSTLVFSNICLRKGDKAGLITFSDKMGNKIPAEKTQGQLGRIMEALYNQKTLFKEANYELLYQSLRNEVKTRSMLLLFTNFESEYAMRRALPMLQRMNKKHVLVVVFFKNNELNELTEQAISTAKELVQATVAENLTNIKYSISRTLRQHGIQSIYTSPQDLSVNTINKYLELKAKGAI